MIFHLKIVLNLIPDNKARTFTQYIYVDDDVLVCTNAEILIYCDALTVFGKFTTELNGYFLPKNLFKALNDKNTLSIEGDIEGKNIKVIKTDGKQIFHISNDICKYPNWRKAMPIEKEKIEEILKI